MIELFWKNINTIYSDETKGRIWMKIEKDRTVSIYIDVHGFTRTEASVFVRNVVACYRGDFSLRVIHGFHRGQVLRKLFLFNYEEVSSRFVRAKQKKRNPGETKITVRKVS